jgi:hypothetical protein
MQSNTCFYHVLAIAGVIRALERRSGRRRTTHHFRRVELTPPGNVGKLSTGRRIIDDLLYSSVATVYTYPSILASIFRSPDDTFASSRPIFLKF